MVPTPRLFSRRALFCAAVLGCLSLGLSSLHAQAREPGPKLTKIEAVLTVKPDRTAELLEKRRITILAPGAIRPAGQQVATWIEGMETLDLIEAYTEKSDGRRLDVEPNRIFRRDAASDDNGGYLVDQKALTVIYPDLAIGDTVVLTTKLTIKAGSFPGHLVTQFMHSSEVKSDQPGFKVTLADSPREIPDAGSSYRVVVPRGMEIHVEIAGEGVTGTVIEDEATITHVATFGERVDAKDKSRSAMEQGPRIFISTLRDYEDLGQNYWAAAAPHVEVTPAIQAMADEITQGIDEPRKQAEAISLWVKRNIRYIIVHQGIGRDLSIVAADTVLRNRYGECKEHAVLMTALLAAKKIEAELVLIQLGDITTIPETPTLGFFNHLIVYLPEFNMLDDPTSATTPFGSLAKEGRNKPVVVMSQRGARVAMSPPAP
ncbi:MAG: DUF3857 domain-containing transglutaminase family protein [Pseudorhodoplanes sp.]